MSVVSFRVAREKYKNIFLICIFLSSLLGVKNAWATPRSVSFSGLIQNFRRASPPLSYAESPRGEGTTLGARGFSGAVSGFGQVLKSEQVLACDRRNVACSKRSDSGERCEEKKARFKLNRVMLNEDDNENGFKTNRSN